MKLLNKWIRENHEHASQLEEEYFSLNELKIDTHNSYQYESIEYNQNPAWTFADRCDNKLVVVYIKRISEFKTGYKIANSDSLIFDPTRLGKDAHLIKPCPDDKKLNTVFKILINEVIPTYILTKKPSKLVFNPVSSSRNRLTDIIMNKTLEYYPQLLKKDNYLIHV